jgi:aminopeptidase-like protein
MFSFISFTVVTIGSEPEEFPWFNSTCYICHPFPSWSCCSSVALCTFLVEGMSTLRSFKILHVLIKLNLVKSGSSSWLYLCNILH